MFKKKKIANRTNSSPQIQANAAVNQIINLGALDKKVRLLIKELPSEDPLRKQYASLPRKGCSKDVTKFERLEKELQNLVTILEKQVPTADEYRIVIK